MVYLSGTMICRAHKLELDGAHCWSVTGQFQCICGGKWPVCCFFVDQYGPMDGALESMMDSAIQQIQNLAENSPLCGGHDDST